MVGVGRGELTEAAWAQIQPLPPAVGRPGGRWSDHRMVISGILWKLHWCALAGPARTVRALDHLPRPLCALAAGWDLGPVVGACPDQVRCGRRGRVGGERGRQRDPGPPARRRGSPPAGPGRAKGGTAHAQDEALGHSRGGLTTKLHLAVDGKGRPLAVTLTPGSVMRAPSSRRCWMGSECRDREVLAGLASGLPICWPTGVRLHHLPAAATPARHWPYHPDSGRSA
jgi:transposase